MKDRATEYAKSVAEGKVVAGKLHIQACKRHLMDLKRQGKEDFPYFWDVKKSNRIIEYAETLTIIEGDGPKQVKLFPFQCFDLGVPFGWYRKKDEKRRFRRSYRSLARQNGKTFINGIQGSYVPAFSGYHNGKCATAATKQSQAKLAWEEIVKFIRADFELSEIFEIKEYINLITARNTDTTIEALSRDKAILEGTRYIYASVDELHQHRDNAVYKSIYNGMRGLPEALISVITPRGRSMNTYCYDVDRYCQNVLNGSVIAEDYFVDIYCLDTDDDPFDEKVWIKSNPYLCATPFGMEVMQNDAKTAKEMGGEDLVDYLVKCCNVWPYMADNQYIDVEKWNETAVEIGLEEMRGRSCYVGLDLSSGGDLTSLALDFDVTDIASSLPVNIPFSENSEQLDVTYLYSHSFMPRGRLEEHIQTDMAPYDLWEEQGLITITGGESDYKNDYKFIIKHLHDIQEEYDLEFLGIGYDPHNADGIISDLEEFGVPLLTINQSAKFLSDATEDIRLSVKSKRVFHDKNNALLTWSFVNAKTVSNSFGEMKIDKEPRAKYKRIDPCDACIDAHSIRMKMPEEINTEKELDNYLENMGWK